MTKRRIVHFRGWHLVSRDTADGPAPVINHNSLSVSRSMVVYKSIAILYSHAGGKARGIVVKGEAGRAVLSFAFLVLSWASAFICVHRRLRMCEASGWRAGEGGELEPRNTGTTRKMSLTETPRFAHSRCFRFDGLIQAFCRTGVASESGTCCRPGLPSHISRISRLGRRGS